MNPESSTEQSIKALQAQNAQFQELIKNLAQGQQDLKTLLSLEEEENSVVQPETQIWEWIMKWGWADYPICWERQSPRKGGS